MNTKQTIANSLIELMFTKHLDKIYVIDIANKANITRQTFYRHYKDKYDVINWYYDQNIESLFECTNSVQGIRDNLIKKYDFYKERMAFFRHAYRCNSQNSLTDHEYKRIYTSLSAKIQAKTGIRESSQSQELIYALSFFIHGLLHLTIDWLYASCPISSEEFADIIIDLMPIEVKNHLK